MPALTHYLTNNSVSVGSDLSATDPGAEAYRSPVTGWIVGTGATLHSEWFNDTERASSTFTGTTVPDGSLDTTNGDFWVSPGPLTGTFDSANWSIHFASRANTNGGAQDGRMRCRLFKGPNQNGSGATEITAAQQSGGLVTNLGTAATLVSTATFNPGSFTLTNEYYFVQLAWERTGAGGMTSADVNARVGNGSGTGCRVVTANFVSPIIVTVNQTVETETINAVQWAPKNRMVRQTVETEIINAVTERKSRTLAQTIETEIINALTRRKTRTVGLTTETETIFAVTLYSPLITVPVNLVIETETIQALGKMKVKALLQLIEIESVQPVSWSPKHRLVNQVAEIESILRVTAVSGAGGGDLPKVVRYGRLTKGV